MIKTEKTTIKKVTKKGVKNVEIVKTNLFKIELEFEIVNIDDVDKVSVLN